MAAADGTSQTGAASWATAQSVRAGRPAASPRPIGVALLVFVACLVLLATVLVLVVGSREGAPGANGNDAASGPAVTAVDRIIPYNVSVSYVGRQSMYFGPSSLPPCGEIQPCASAGNASVYVTPGTDFSWTLTLENRDNASGHWIELVTVNSPFALQDLHPSAPMEVCAGCTSPPLRLYVLEPSTPGPYYLDVTVTTFD